MNHSLSAVSSFQGKALPPTTWLLLLNSVLAPTQTARILGVTLDSQLSLTATTRSCRFMLHNIRWIRSLLTQNAVQVLVFGHLTSIDYCTSLLAGLPASAIRQLQLIQNAAALLVFNPPQFSHTTALLCCLHFLKLIVIDWKVQCVRFREGSFGRNEYKLSLVMFSLVCFI